MNFLQTKRSSATIWHNNATPTLTMSVPLLCSQAVAAEPGVPHTAGGHRGCHAHPRWILLRLLPQQVGHLDRSCRSALAGVVLYRHNSQPIWLVSCVYQISPGSSDHQHHNSFLFLNLNFLCSCAQNMERTPHHFKMWNELPITSKS